MQSNYWTIEWNQIPSSQKNKWVGAHRFWLDFFNLPVGIRIFAEEIFGDRGTN